jgi:hypothetical protein
LDREAIITYTPYRIRNDGGIYYTACHDMQAGKDAVTNNSQVPVLYVVR